MITNQERARLVFTCLSSDVRLDIFRCLVREEPDGLVAGDIAEKLEIPPTNLSFHLKALTQAGLLNVNRQGRFQRYRANIAQMTAVTDWLQSQCCQGRPDICDASSDFFERHSKQERRQ